MKVINVGLIGFGTVGAGVVKLLSANALLIEKKLGARLILKRIVDLDLTTDRGVEVAPGVLTANVSELLDDPEISIVMELIGGYEPARTFVLRAIAAGKHVVTANKALLAVHGEELFTAAAVKGVELLFEPAVGGGIPVLSAIRGNLSANRFSTVLGILNGTCNYILTRMTEEGAEFAAVLKTAQELGYAEADPTFDVEGIDTAHKLCLLVSLCFGSRVKLEQVHTEGISALSPVDISFAREFGYKIKLLAIGKQDDGCIEARVHPTMIPLSDPLADVNGVFNAVRLAGDFVGPVMFSGRGAGMNPTASAVVGELIEISRNILAGIGRRTPPLGYLDASMAQIPLKPMGEIVSKYYLRFSVVDRPKVLSRIAGVLGDHGISIESMIQTARSTQESVSIVIMTHEAREADVRAALAQIDGLEFITEKTNLIRIEDNLE